MSLVVAVGVDGNGDKHPLGAVEGATESNRARRPEKDWRGVSASILEGVNEMLTVTRL